MALEDRINRVRVWFYSRNLASSESISHNGDNQETGGFGFPPIQHWAVKLDYMSERDPNTVNLSMLYEAFCSEMYLEAKATPHGGDEEAAWRASAGFTFRDLGFVEGVTQTRAENYCRQYTALRILYNVLRNNCQKFVEDFKREVLNGLGSSLPPNAGDSLDATARCIVNPIAFGPTLSNLFSSSSSTSPNSSQFS